MVRLQEPVWVSEWNVGQLSRFDPTSGWKVWKLPGARPQACAVLNLGPEVLEETESRIPAGVVVSHLVGAEREALRADERDVFHK